MLILVFAWVVNLQIFLFFSFLFFFNKLSLSNLSGTLSSAWDISVNKTALLFLIKLLWGHLEISLVITKSNITWINIAHHHRAMIVTGELEKLWSEATHTVHTSPSLDRASPLAGGGWGSSQPHAKMRRKRAYNIHEHDFLFVISKSKNVWKLKGFSELIGW